jgi:hypothetical protein
LQVLHHKIQAAAATQTLLERRGKMETHSLNRKRQKQQQAADKIKQSADKRKTKPLQLNGMQQKKVNFHD